MFKDTRLFQKIANPPANPTGFSIKLEEKLNFLWPATKAQQSEAAALKMGVSCKRESSNPS